MKTKQLIPLVFFLLSLSRTYGQSKITYRIGITGGFNASQVTTPSLSATNNVLLRYNGGLTLEQRFNSAIALFYQLNYLRIGGSADVTGLTNGILKIVDDYSYISLPIIVRVRPKTERFFVEAGLQTGYYLSGGIYAKGQDTQVQPHLHQVKLDAGWTGGLGYQIRTHFVIDARYYCGLKKLAMEYSAADPVTGIVSMHYPIAQYHRAYLLNLSYLF